MRFLKVRRNGQEASASGRSPKPHSKEIQGTEEGSATPSQKDCFGQGPEKFLRRCSPSLGATKTSRACDCGDEECRTLRAFPAPDSPEAENRCIGPIRCEISPTEQGPRSTNLAIERRKALVTQCMRRPTRLAPGRAAPRRGCERLDSVKAESGCTGEAVQREARVQGFLLSSNFDSKCQEALERPPKRLCSSEPAPSVALSPSIPPAFAEPTWMAWRWSQPL